MEILILVLVFGAGVFAGTELAEESKKPWPPVIGIIFLVCVAVLFLAYPNESFVRCQNIDMISDTVDLSGLQIKLEKPYKINIGYNKSWLFLKPNNVLVEAWNITTEIASKTPIFTLKMR